MVIEAAATALGAPTPRQTVLVTLVVAAVLVLYRPSWRVLRHVVTIAHEGGHAVVATMAGRRLRGVRLHSDTSGLTVSAGRPTGPGVVLTLLAGYPAASLLGLVGALALARGLDRAALWGAAVALALLLVQIRNLFGVVSVVATGAVLVGISLYGTPSGRVAAAHLLVWFLLAGGLRASVELQRARRGRARATSDADQLARLTHVPGIAWVALFVLVAAGSLGGGLWLLVPHARF